MKKEKALKELQDVLKRYKELQTTCAKLKEKVLQSELSDEEKKAVLSELEKWFSDVPPTSESWSTPDPTD